MKIISMGIDISKWQGDFNMTRAKAEGVRFIIIKGGGGDKGLYKDPRFDENYTKAKKLSLPVGVYWYSRALSVAEAIQEAEYFHANVLLGKQFELPVYIDVEDRTQLSRGKALLTSIISAWCDTLEKKGYFVGIYSSTSSFKDYMDDAALKKYAHWAAEWRKECTYPNTESLGMWQYGGEVNRIRSNVIAGVICDQNYMLKDYPTIIKNAGLNGYGKSAAIVGKKSVDELAREVISGAWGTGQERKKRLEAAGYDYTAVQTRVNEILK